MRSTDMKDEMKDDEILKRYLLGGLEEEQADDLERRLLEDGDLFELAEAVEGDLLAAAARGDLSAAERGHVLWRLAASPAGRTRLALARGLTSLGRERVPAEVVAFRLLARPAVRAAAVAASLVIAAGGFWLATQTVMPGPGTGANMIARGLPARPAPVMPEVHRKPVAPPLERIAGQTPAPAMPPSRQEGTARETSVRPEPAPLLLQLALTAVRSAGGGIPRLEIPPETREIELQLPLTPGEPSTSFAAILRNASTQEEIRREERIAVREVDGRRIITFSVPSTDLDPGIYEIEVRGIGPEGDELLGRPMFEVASS
jgi:hypothetical protein